MNWVPVFIMLAALLVFGAFMLSRAQIQQGEMVVVEDDGQFTADCRQVVADRILSSFCLRCHADPNDVTVKVDATSEQSHMVTMLWGQIIIYCYCYWGQEKLRIIYKYEGDQPFAKSKWFKIKSNFIDINKLDKFFTACNKKYGTFKFKFGEDKAIEDGIDGARYLAETMTEEQIKQLMFAAIAEWELPNVRRHYDDYFKSLKNYVAVMAYIIKKHKDEFVKYLAEAEEDEDENEEEVA